MQVLTSRVAVGGLQTFLTLHYVELDALVLPQLAEVIATDGGLVDEHVRTATVNADEAETLAGLEPLQGTRCTTISLVATKGSHAAGPQRAVSGSGRATAHRGRDTTNDPVHAATRP